MFQCPGWLLEKKSYPVARFLEYTTSVRNAQISRRWEKRVILF